MYLIDEKDIPENPCSSCEGGFDADCKECVVYCQPRFRYQGQQSILSKATKIDLNKAANRWREHENNSDAYSDCRGVSFEDYLKQKAILPEE